MSNHAQTILHEISLLEEQTCTHKLKFSVQKTNWRTNNSTFCIIKTKHFSIDHNSSSVNSCQIMYFQKCYDGIMSVSFLKTWKCPKSKTHGEFQLNGFQRWPPLTNPENFWHKMSEFDSYVQSWTPPKIYITAIMFWLIRRQQIFVFIMLTCSIWCLTICKRF